MSDRIAEIWKEYNQPRNHRIIGAVIVGLSAGIGAYSTHFLLSYIFHRATIHVLVSAVLGGPIGAILSHYVSVKIDM